MDLVKLKGKLKGFNREGSNLPALANAVHDGEIEALPVYLYLKRLEKYAKEAAAVIEGHAQDEFGEGAEQMIYGASVGRRATATRYKFSAEVGEMEKVVKARKEQEKAALKAQQGGTVITDAETGEVIPAATAILGTSKLFITIKD